MQCRGACSSAQLSHTRISQKGRGAGNDYPVAASYPINPAQCDSVALWCLLGLARKL